MRLLPQDGWLDQRSIDRALDLAEESASFASPNPTVGCVLRIQEKIVGEGAHRYDDRDHAEIAALKAAAAAGHDLRGATAYVTLEPCSHHGRTGPCADALIAAGIARCVVATVDPNPMVSGRGLARLHDAGVEVELLPPDSASSQRARRLNDAFAFSVQKGRPFVTLKAAVSRDGKSAPEPAKRLTRDPVWLSGMAAREDVQHLRHTSDAVLTGIGTVLADDPSLTDRTGLSRRKPLVRVVLDSQLRIPLTSKILSPVQDDLLIFCAEDASRTREEALRGLGAKVIRLPTRGGRLVLSHVFGALAPFRSVMVEAGPALTDALLSENFVDKVILYQAPVELGPTALPFAHTFTLATLQQRLSSPTQKGFANGDAEDLRLTGYLHDPWTDLSI